MSGIVLSIICLILIVGLCVTMSWWHHDIVRDRELAAREAAANERIDRALARLEAQLKGGK